MNAEDIAALALRHKQCQPVRLTDVALRTRLVLVGGTASATLICAECEEKATFALDLGRAVDATFATLLRERGAEVVDGTFPQEITDAEVDWFALWLGVETNPGDVAADELAAWGV